MKKIIIVTGGAGFIGSNFINKIAVSVKKEFDFLVLDSLDYSGILDSIEETLEKYIHIRFLKLDIRDVNGLSKLKKLENIVGIIHFAAQSHVDNSIKNPNIFVETNIVGTMNLLNLSLYFQKKEPKFKFVHVSTDEVYGSLEMSEPAFVETSRLNPSSPYSASKASSDLLVISYIKTYSLNAVISRCSNNYGPCQFPEKLIPLVISNAQLDQQIPIYGDGLNIRDWVYVDDHNRGVWLCFLKGRLGNIYNFGGMCEQSNIILIKTIIEKLGKNDSLLKYIEDRPGHDRRYALDISKAKNELGWKPLVNFNEGIDKTIKWYSEEREWTKKAKKREFNE